MRNVAIGVAVAAAILAAFYFGVVFEENQDGPLEEIGETIEKSTE